MQRPEGDRIDFSSLPDLDQEWARLDAYQKANEEEAARVKEALAKPKEERTRLEHTLIGYSTHGTANRHNF